MRRPDAGGPARRGRGEGEFPRRGARLAALGLLGVAVGLGWGWARGHRAFGPYRAYDLGPECLVAGFGSLAVVATVLLGRGARGLAWLRWPALGRLGTISYGIYLHHWPIFVYIARPLAPFIPGRWQPAYLVVPPLAILAAELSWRLVERPALALKGRLAYRPASGRAVSSPTASRPGRRESRYAPRRK